MNARSVRLDIFLYIVVHYKPVICLLNYLIRLYAAKISCYRRVIYKFKYLKLQTSGKFFLGALLRAKIRVCETCVSRGLRRFAAICGDLL